MLGPSISHPVNIIFIIQDPAAYLGDNTDYSAGPVLLLKVVFYVFVDFMQSQFRLSPSSRLQSFVSSLDYRE